MYYGRISTSGKIIGTSTYSNNFSASGSGGTVTITLGQWTYYAPTFTVTSSPDPGNAISSNAIYSIQRQDPSDYSTPWVVTVNTYNASGILSGKNFSLRGHTGMTRIFDAQTVTLTPEIITFGDAKVLALKTTIGGNSLYLDKGTVLIGVGESMKLQLGETSVSDDDRNTWELSGWTYGGGSGASGTPWSTDDGKTNPYFELETDPAGSGPATTPYTFAIKGVRSAGSGQQYISSDPVVRLSSVPPGGISL